MRPKKKKISVATTSFNEFESLPVLIEQVYSILGTTNYDLEIVVCDNGSTDGSIELLRKMASEDSRLRYVKLTRNFGHQGGILAALSLCCGDAIVTLDADLQHPVSLIPKLIEQWEKGFLVVNTKRDSSHSHKRNLANYLFYFFLEKWTGLEIGESDFRLMDKRVLNELLKLQEVEKFFRGLVGWLGFSSTCINYKQDDRKFGKSKFTGRHLIHLAWMGITSFTNIPIQLLTKLGFILFLPSAIAVLFYLVQGFLYLFTSIDLGIESGWPTIVVAITFFGSIQLLSVGIIGEYIGRIFLESKRRPSFIVLETSLLEAKKPSSFSDQ